MKFVATYKPREGFDEATQKRALEVFVNWAPPDGLRFLHHWARADGQGGVAIIETDDALTIFQVTAVFEVFHTFEIHPIVELNDSVPEIYNAIQWREGAR